MERMDPLDAEASPAAGVRQRARAEMKRAILDAGRARLASEGARDLSLRAVARDVGMVSSAVYRYVPNRDALLTELIIESYDSLGEAAERGEAAVPRPDLRGRFRATGGAAREWGLAHPHEWALIYGSPIPDYAAPQDTVRAANRIPALLTALLREAVAMGRPLPDGPLPAAEDEALAVVVEFSGTDVPREAVARGLMGWTYIVGSVSAQVFGQRNNVIVAEHAAAFFDGEMERIAEFIGI